MCNLVLVSYRSAVHGHMIAMKGFKGKLRNPKYGQEFLSSMKFLCLLLAAERRYLLILFLKKYRIVQKYDNYLIIVNVLRVKVCEVLD